MLARNIIRQSALKSWSPRGFQPLAARFSTDDEKANDKIISKTAFVNMIADKFVDVDKKDVHNIVNASLDLINESVMKEGKEIRFMKFGTFKMKTIKGRERRNPATGASFHAETKHKLSFKASSSTDKA